jgi:hypothetical protein
MSQVNEVAYKLCQAAVENASGDISAFRGAVELLRRIGKPEGALAEYSSADLQRGLESLLSNTQLLTAGEILASYSYDLLRKRAEYANLVLPPGVGVVEGIESLSEYFKLRVPRYGRGAVDPELITWLKGLRPHELSSQFENDPKSSQEILITPVVTYTVQCSRGNQELRLAREFMFASPGEQALIAAAHACNNNGEDIFRGCIVRGSIPGKAIAHDSDRGFTLVDCPDTAEQLGDDMNMRDYAASGVPR